MLRLLEPEKFKVKGASISYQSEHGIYWMSVGSRCGGSYGDWYKTAVAAKRDFGKKWGKGAKWEQIKDPF